MKIKNQSPLRIISKWISAFFVSFLVVLLIPNRGFGWSLKTHIWIAQQVINDITDDGHLTILGKNYPVSPHILQAVREYPDFVRMGSLGPDVFPDPLVGQMTTHPGIINGWQTDDWLKQVLASAKSPQEIAFAFGFAIHAAGDIFAHTYVNAYAGDIFVLSDAERDVELRHFVLEKYIEGLTPDPVLPNGTAVQWRTALQTPATYLAQRLILNNAVAKQNLKSKAGVHLSAMYAVREGVEGLNSSTQQLISFITKRAAKYYKEQLQLTADMATARGAIIAAEKVLQSQEVTLDIKRKAYDAALLGLAEANEFVTKYPEVISFQTKLLGEQTKVAADLTSKSLQVAADVAGAIGGLQNQITDLSGKIASAACNVLGPRSVLGVPNPPRIACDELTDGYRNSINSISNQINVLNASAEAARKAAEAAAKIKDETKRKIDEINNLHNKYVKGISEGTYQAAVLTTKAELAIEVKKLKKAAEVLAEAKERQKQISDKINVIEPIIDKIKETIDKYNSITLLVKNWLDGIDNSCEKYIGASQAAGLKMLANSGNPLSEYSEWYKCNGYVFVGVPQQVPGAVCTVQKFLENVKREYDNIIAGMPVVLRWMINPTSEAERLALKKLEPALKEAEARITEFLARTTDRSTVEFISLLMNPEEATRDRLTSVYSVDRSGKKLLLIPEVASLIEKDLAISNGRLDPTKFFPLRHSVTLAKLALMNPSSLNMLIGDLAGEYVSPLYGKNIYDSNELNFCLLINAVRSIDGNHQWQAYGLPYPRRNSIQISPATLPYGYDRFRDPLKGFRIWEDTYLRERVFLRLFDGSVLGALAERKELKWPAYQYPECPQNPYPATQSAAGYIHPDKRCIELINPHSLIAETRFNNVKEYAAYFFQCQEGKTDTLYSTVVASFETKAGVERRVNELQQLFPDLHYEISTGTSPNNYWTVLIASCTTKERAWEARDIAIRRRIDSKAFIVNSKDPFNPIHVKEK